MSPAMDLPIPLAGCARNEKIANVTLAEGALVHPAWNHSRPIGTDGMEIYRLHLTDWREQGLGCSGSQRHYHSAFPPLITLFGPPRHHPHSLIPKISACIGAANAVVVDMGQLTLDRIWVPEAAFVED